MGVYRYALNLVVGALVVFTAFAGYLAVTDDGLDGPPATPLAQPLAGGGVAPELVKTESDGDRTVMVYESRPEDCDFYEGWALELLSGSPRVVSSTATRYRGRCVYRDDATGHQASLTDVRSKTSYNGDPTLDRYKASVPKPGQGVIEHPKDIGDQAWAQAVELPDDRRRYILVWYDGNFHKLVVRRAITADAETELQQIYAATRRGILN